MEDRTCPQCGNVGVPILYGYPTDEAFEEAEAGRVELGGCIVSGDDPGLACTQCNTRWANQPPGH